MEKLAPLPLQQARILMLQCLGLNKARKKRPEKGDILDVIRQINFLQLDSISVVARAHLHILFSRLGAYQTAWLDELQAEGKLFEYFAHAMCYLPIEKFPIYWPEMMRQRSEGYFSDWTATRQDRMRAMLEHIRRTGAVKSSDFKSERTGPWWGWKEDKALLEALFYQGELMISRREGFQRVYDLRERVLPLWQPEKGLSMEQSRKLRFLEAAKALGIATETWLIKQTYLSKGQNLIRELVQEGKLLRGEVTGIKKEMLVHPDNLQLYEQAARNELKATDTKLLSMFDPLMVDRARVKELFNFDYRIQVYLPKDKRQKGYYLLPVLHQGNLAGTVDAKAYRKERNLTVFSISLEEGFKPTRALAKGLAKELCAYASWLGLDHIAVEKTDPAELRDGITAWIAAFQTDRSERSSSDTRVALNQ